MNKYRLEIDRRKLRETLDKNFLTPVVNHGAYILHYFKDSNGEFIVYDNDKGKPYKALYTALRLPPFLKPFLKEEIKTIKEQISANLHISETEQIGSDEVGFGDFFGPLVVCSAYLSDDIRNKIAHLRITDSKKISDVSIFLIGQKLSQLVPHIKNIVPNPKYNELIKKGYNMNKIKAILHHNVLTKLKDKTNYAGKLYIDKFVEPQKFNEYIEGLKIAPFVLVPKGEENALSIATASILARYYFLLEMQKLDNQYTTKFPLGAGKDVDIFAENFLKEKGPSNLKLVTKHNFRNFKDLFEDSSK